MTNNYDGSKIQVLKGLAAVRHRPAMYIGDTDKKGLHHLVWEILDNSIDEAMAGFAKNIYITIDADSETISVEDDGRGIPVDLHPTEGKSTLEVAMTVLHAGGKMTSDAGGYVASGGLHGVGASCVNALSDSMTVEVHRDGFVYKQEYCRGEPLSDVKKLRKLEKNEKPTGTKSTWHADIQIFKHGVKLDENEIIRRVRETCFLNRGLRIAFENKATNTKHDFKFEGGIADYVLYLVQNKNGIYPEAPIYAQKTSENMQVEIALSWTDDDDCLLFSYANNINTIDGGTHLSGFKTALTRTVNKFAFSSNYLKEKDDGLEGRDIQEGLCAIVSIKLPQPQFVGQTKAKLGTVEAESIVSAITNDLLTDYFERNPKSLAKIVDRAVLAQRARKAAKDAASALKKKSFLGQSGRIPGKLRDCRSSDNSITELFIVEGDSAAGSATGGRDSETQAILSNKGKIINAEKSNLNDLFKNDEIINLMLCIGTGVKDTFDIAKVKYGKIIIMCLHGDTRIKTLNGSDATIQNLAEHKKPVWIWTRQGDEIVPYLAQPPQKTSSHKKYALLTFNDDTQIKCTLDHKFQVNNPDENDSRIIYKNGHAYIEAQDLQTSDSLCHVIYGKMQIAKDAEYYETMRFASAKTGVNFVHRIVWNHFANSSAKEIYATGKYDIHHVNHNHLDNTPENLTILTAKEHLSHHFDPVLHSQRIRDLHAQNHYDGTSYFIEYNSTIEHAERISDLHQKGFYNMSRGFKNYNGTELQKNNLKKNWENGVYSTQEYRDKLSMGVKNSFTQERKIQCKEQTKQAWDNPEIRRKLTLGRGFSVIDKVLATNDCAINDLTEQLFDKSRQKNDPKFVTFMKNFESKQELIREYLASRSLNMRIKNIAIIEEEQEQDFYCFNIPETGNFVLANGLISSNCDADDDGYHIRTLLLTFFYRFMRPLIEHGYVYIAQAPLYMIERKNDPIYCWTDEELQNNLTQLGGKYDVKRFKGLGEMDAEQLAETTMRPGNRRLLQVTMDDAIESERLLTVLMGKNVQLRKQHITNNINNSLVSVEE